MTRNNILEALCAEQIQRGTEAMQQGDDGRVGHLTSWVVVQHVLPCKVYARHLGCLVCFQGLHKQRFDGVSCLPGTAISRLVCRQSAPAEADNCLYVPAVARSWMQYLSLMLSDAAMLAQLLSAVKKLRPLELTLTTTLKKAISHRSVWSALPTFSWRLSCHQPENSLYCCS